MQSKTSFFNWTVFRKTVSRFWPVWGLYFLIGLIALPVVLISGRFSYATYPARLQDYILNLSLYGGLGMSAIFALLSAMAVWSFLYNARAAHGTACLPIRREGLFASVALAGLVPLLSANAALYALALLAELYGGFVHIGGLLQGFAITSLMLVFFYGFATFCAQLTGNILALPALYIVLNFLCVGVEMIVRYILSLFVFGLNLDLEAFATKFFSPVVGIAMRCRVLSMPDAGQSAVELEGWGVLIAYAAVGAALLAAALLLYRRRRMETAGDVVAVRVLKPVFRWCMALGCALCLGCLLFLLLFGSSTAETRFGSMVMLLSMILFMFLGAFLGWFAAAMLMKKSFRVLREGWGGFGACCILIAALLCACEFDLFGFERYVPPAERVESVVLSARGERAYLEQPESIAEVCALHAGIAANKTLHEQSGLDYGVRMTLHYTLRGGRTVAREYVLRYDTSNPATYGDAGVLQEVLNCDEAIRDRKETSFPITAETLNDGYVSCTMTAAECAEAAGYADAEEYILRELCGRSSREIAEMDEETREALIRETVAYRAMNSDELMKTYDYALDGSWADDTVRTEAAMTLTPELLGDADLDKALFRYDWRFAPRDLLELYNTCILPDIEDQTLGRIWLITDDAYARTVYAAELVLEARRPMERSGEAQQYDYESFQTTPTLYSERTNAWLRAHGVPLHTISEINGAS